MLGISTRGNPQQVFHFGRIPSGGTTESKAQQFTACCVPIQVLCFQVVGCPEHLSVRSALYNLLMSCDCVPKGGFSLEHNMQARSIVKYYTGLLSETQFLHFYDLVSHAFDLVSAAMT